MVPKLHIKSVQDTLIGNSDLQGKNGEINLISNERNQGEEAQKNAISASIFPNPTSAILHIDLADYLGSDVSLTLVDAFGRDVQSQKVAESHHLARAEMDVRTLENGLYFLRIESADKRPLVLRVLVEHGR